MKILHLYRDLLGRGGIPHQTRRLIEGQLNLGHQVASMSLSGDLTGKFIAANPALKAEIIPNGFAGMADVRNCLLKHKPDVVHITGLWIPLHQLWTREVVRAGIPYVVSTHGNLSPHGMNVRFGEKKIKFYHIWAKRFWHRRLDLPLLRQSAGVHAHSKYELELLTSSGIKNAFVAPVGVDDDWVNLPDVGRRQHHKRVTFLHLGRLDIYHKGLDLICEAAQKLVAAGLGEQCRFLFVGPTVNDSSTTLQRMASELGSGVLEVRDPVWGKAKLSIWEEADYFLNLYRFAGIALAPCEAIGAGLPLVASREGNLGDWTLEANMGWAAPLDSAKIYSLLRNILTLSESDYSLLVRNASNFAKRNSWANVAQQIINGYSTVLN